MFLTERLRLPAIIMGAFGHCTKAARCSLDKAYAGLLPPDKLCFWTCCWLFILA